MVEIKRFLLCLPAELREAIRKEAEQKGISSNSLVVTILWKHFHEAGQPPLSVCWGIVERAGKVSGAAGLSPEQPPMSRHPANLLDRIRSGLGVSAEKPGGAFVPNSRSGICLAGRTLT